jgi:hypothetical protein
MELRDQADYYRTHPPRCIAGFGIAPDELPGFRFDGHLAPSAIKAPEGMIDGPELLNPIFRLACTCGHDHHHVIGHHWRNPDYSNVLVFLSPIVLRCASCGKETEVIDTDRHGYDAELGHIVATARGEGDRGEYRCDQCGPQAFRIWVRFEYPDDLFRRTFKGFQRRQQDLFSWFTLVGKCPCCSRELDITDFECA